MAKTVNYTKEQEAQLIAGYNMEADAETRTAQVKMLSKSMDKKIASVVAKLSGMNHYVPKTYVNKKGDTPVRKDAIVNMIAKVMGQTSESFDTLTKANKSVLESILEFVKPEEIEDDSQKEEDAPEVMEEAETA
jgi:ABC-type Fe3+/spermidine/putrescine transport system ATPase subunit